MSFTTCSVATNNIATLDDLPNDVGGLTPAQLKALFDKFGADFVAWFNATHIVELNTVMPASGQIKFPAVQNPSADANTLDDYEEGTWTIGLEFGGASVGMTTSYNTGAYTKIGNTVHLTGLFQLSAKGTSVGNAVITGLPFICKTDTQHYSAVTLLLNSVSFADYPEGQIAPAAANITLKQITNAGVRSELTDANFADTSAIVLDVTYFV